MSEHREKFESSIDNEQFSCWDDFIHRMAEDGTFVDGIVVVASALFLHRSLIIHQHRQRPLLFKSSFCFRNNHQTHLAYNWKTVHYNSVCSIDGNKLDIDKS
jgi:hypothetical protein